MIPLGVLASSHVPAGGGTPVIGGVVSSATGTVSLTTVPSGGWMLATLIGDGTEGSASASLTGTTAGSLLVGAEPIQASWLAGQVSYGGAVGFNSRSIAEAGGYYAAVWLSGTAAGGTATATRSATYVSSLYPWVLVEIR